MCIDVGPSMSLTPLDGGETNLERAIRVARQITQQKVMKPAGQIAWGWLVVRPPPCIFRVALGAVLHVKCICCTLQMFAGSKDLLGLVLFGTQG